jgi:hypothetical protein
MAIPSRAGGRDWAGPAPKEGDASGPRKFPAPASWLPRRSGADVRRQPADRAIRRRATHCLPRGARAPPRGDSRRASCGGASRLPTTGTFQSWPIAIESGPLADTRVKQPEQPEQRTVSGHYFAAPDIPLLAGRTFDERDAAHAPGRTVVRAKTNGSVFIRRDLAGMAATLEATPMVTAAHLTPAC